jgi:hypothetical protein
MRTAVDIPDPVFILAAPRSFSSVVCAMLGQHPQMYGLPETHLFRDETLEPWLRRASEEVFPLTHGLLRAVAQLCFGEQTERSVKFATGWLYRRSTFTSSMIFEELARRAAPSILVDKSPSMVYSLESMQRVHQCFPQARLIHLTRHPRAHGHSVLKYLKLLMKPQYRPRNANVKSGTAPEWIVNLAHFPYSPEIGAGGSETLEDPQRGWYVLNRNIVTFLKSVPQHQWIVVRGEDLLADTDRGLRQIAKWLGIRTDSEAIEEMKHPERSPYAYPGPPGARLGNDIFFLQDPVLHPSRAVEQSLDGPLGWRTDGIGFLPEVRELARNLGYQ